ncbi:MAG: nucleoside triphosphate pyrophosphohydrolase [Bacteroidota bacterium]
MKDTVAAFERLSEIVEELREKCPWDRKQTKESIRHLTIEETYELADAILHNDYGEMKEELGDLLMHTIFYASMARENGEFDMQQVLEAQIEKLIRRHPHIYGDLVGATEDQINANWEKIKAQERAAKGIVKRSALDGVPDSMPSLIKAHRIQEKAANLGFDWATSAGVLDKIQEEVAEIAAAETADEREAEMGDLLFTLVNYCRHVGINAEDALSRSSAKFKRRFQAMEQHAWDQKQEISDFGMEEMESLWEKVKSAQRES